MPDQPMTVDEAMALALEHQNAGRLAEAEWIYRQVLSTDPRNTDALHLLGILALHVGQYETAASLIGSAASIAPHASYYCNLGTAQQLCGRLGEAIASFHRAIELDPTSADAYFNLGNALKLSHQTDAAFAAFRKAVDVQPSHMPARINLAAALREAGKTNEAIDVYRDALKIDPNFNEAINNLAITLHDAGQFDEAIELYRRLIAMNPADQQIQINLAHSLLQGGRLDEAADLYRKLLQSHPSAEAYDGLATALLGKGQVSEATAVYCDAIRVQPDSAQAHYKLGLALLLQGKFEEGWREHEWRRRASTGISGVDRLCQNFTQPAWTGEPLADRRLLIHAEQAFGDMIQFVRYVPMIARRGGHVIVQAYPELIRLFRCIDGIELIEYGQTLPPFDLHCPMASLPWIFRTTLQTIPATIPYLHPDPHLSEQWKRRLVDDSNFKIGLAWAGRSEHKNDRNRSLPVKMLAPLADVQGATFFSLQLGQTAGAILPMTDWTSDLKDFADTAALVSNLDLIITVDTSVAHLAGAMGRPVWVLIPFAPDWRWMLDRSDSPWYPTMRLFRQPCIGDWTEPLRRIVSELRSFKIARP